MPNRQIVRSFVSGVLVVVAAGTLAGCFETGAQTTAMAPAPNAPPDARAKIASGDLQSDSPDVKAAKPVIIELVIGYSE